tara:strand:+ start:254 stop:814 length:561 start_codon:yes stop_codon:yes gene_type:complete
MITGVLSLIRTLMQIVLLQKGPEALPRAPVILLFCVALWMVSNAIALFSVDGSSAGSFMLGTLIGAVGLIIYALLINAAGKAERIMQSLSAIIGCGAIISFTVLLFEALLPLLIDEQQVNSLLTLVLLWSVPVEGHIIARAIDRFWYVGLVAASTVFIVQLFLLASLSPAIETDSTSAEEVVAQPA